MEKKKRKEQRCKNVEWNHTMANREWNMHSAVAVAVAIIIITMTMTIIVKIQIKIGNTLALTVSFAMSEGNIKPSVAL